MRHHQTMVDVSDPTEQLRQQIQELTEQNRKLLEQQAESVGRKWRLHPTTEFLLLVLAGAALQALFIVVAYFLFQGLAYLDRLA